MRKYLTCLLLSLLVSVTANAASLDEARSKGYVVETPNGYIKAQPGAPADIDALVKDINAKRHQAYKKIADKNGISVEQVATESYRKRMSRK